MEVQGHEITIARGRPKAVKEEIKDASARKLVTVSVQEKNLNFCYIIKGYENGDVEVRLFPKSDIKSTEWTRIQ